MDTGSGATDLSTEKAVKVAEPIHGILEMRRIASNDQKQANKKLIPLFLKWHDGLTKQQATVQLKDLLFDGSTPMEIDVFLS